MILIFFFFFKKKNKFRGAWEEKGIIKGKINKISNDPKDLGEGSNLWLICGPANIHSTLLK
jgi:hypothetical protein